MDPLACDLLASYLGKLLCERSRRPAGLLYCSVYDRAAVVLRIQGVTPFPSVPLTPFELVLDRSVRNFAAIYATLTKTATETSI
jgi:hypothetical protein